MSQVICIFYLLIFTWQFSFWIFFIWSQYLHLNISSEVVHLKICDNCTICRYTKKCPHFVFIFYINLVHFTFCSSLLFWLELFWNHSCFMLMLCRDGAEEGLTFAFRFTDASISIPNQGILETWRLCIIFFLRIALFQLESWHNFNGFYHFCLFVMNSRCSSIFIFLFHSWISLVGFQHNFGWCLT